MASPAPTSIVLPKIRKRPMYDLKQLAEKIAEHNHNEILDPKIINTNDNEEEKVLIPVAVKNKGKKLMNEVEVGLIKQNRLRRKREIPSKKAKIEIREKNLKNIVESTTVMKSKNQIQTKKKAIDENFESKIQTRNRKKNFIEEPLSTEISSVKEDKSINNNESSINIVDFESSQETASPEVPPKKVVKVNPFKPKAKPKRRPGVFFGPRKRKRDWKTKNKNQQPTSSEIDDIPLSKIIPKLEFPNSNVLISEQIEDVQNYDDLQDNTKIEETVQKGPSQESQQYAQNKLLDVIIKEENEVTAPISVDTTELLAEPRWHTQTDAFYDLLSTVSRGSILNSVNQILKGPDCNTTGSDVNDYSWTELQHAMGATDEEMAILHNFGTNSSQDNQDVTNENRLNLLDLDTNSNQDTQVNSELTFKCRVCDQSYKGIAAFCIHSLDVHGIENPELVNVMKSECMLVCWVCKLVMVGGPEELDEHMARDHEFDDALNSGNGGKDLKNKMVNKLGEILVRALKNLISSTKKPSASKTWSSGATTLLGKLCALRNNEISTIVSSSIANSVLAKDLRKVIGRNGNGSSAKTQPKRSQSAHALRQNAHLAALSSKAPQQLTPTLDPDNLSSIYKCPICNIGFETTSTRNKHISRAHNSPKKSNRIETTVQSCSAQQAAPEEVPETSAKVHPMFSLGAMNSKEIKKFNNTCSEEVRARAKQALRDLEIKSRLKHYTFSGDHPSPNCVIYNHNVNNM